MGGIKIELQRSASEFILESTPYNLLIYNIICRDMSRPLPFNLLVGGSKSKPLHLKNTRFVFNQTIGLFDQSIEI